MKTKSTLLILIISLFASNCYALTTEEDKLKKEIIHRSLEYFEYIHGKFSCPCPYSLDENGKKCGKRSAYFRFSKHKKPLCYPKDIKSVTYPYEYYDYVPPLEPGDAGNERGPKGQ